MYTKCINFRSVVKKQVQNMLKSFLIQHDNLNES